MKISEGGLIENLRQHFQAKVPDDIVGIGDDCAVIPQKENKSLLITTDLLIDGTHFLRDKIAALDLGYKSIAVNLSDIAAMGGTPKYAFLSVALPQDIPSDWLENFIAGINSILTEHQVLLLGGDTSKAKESIFINVVIIGEAEQGKIKYRSGAKPDDIICVTGNLGDSKAGLECILQNHCDNNLAKKLLRQHYRPQPQISEGLFLAQYSGTHAMLDVSDGINIDLVHMQEASNCGAKIDLEKLPVSENLLQFAEEFDANAFEMAAIGGEDYCLLAAIEKNSFKDIAREFQNKFKRALIPIGEITKEKEFKYFLHGKEHKLFLKSFEHF
ncbi:MAG: thiamine-phosphate kinase [Gammaproteobacteria bacterium]|jgi:thiamine-monophosphate kinase